MDSLAHTPDPPYYAVIFTSCRTKGDHGYAETASRMLARAREKPGFLGFEGARQEIGVSVSYWASLDAIRSWRNHPAHQQAQAMASVWYSETRVRICKVERFSSTGSAEDQSRRTEMEHI